MLSAVSEPNAAGTSSTLGSILAVPSSKASTALYTRFCITKASIVNLWPITLNPLTTLSSVFSTGTELIEGAGSLLTSSMNLEKAILSLFNTSADTLSPYASIMQGMYSATPLSSLFPAKKAVTPYTVLHSSRPVSVIASVKRRALL